ncbi:hypothetical protein DPMN_151237 [Dreissena polymorpha]|uniref:Uncharacterized protein n=1 Tax=Dreissena polymorpha TaxID=45954 RepID=A0A9D4FI14_DREPO|nr:hypothetical protein DPMN_151237 [Dreissena polymorpha]
MTLYAQAFNPLFNSLITLPAIILLLTPKDRNSSGIFCPKNPTLFINPTVRSERSSSVDPSRVVDATSIVQIKVGKVPFVGTFHHTILTICHREMPGIGPNPVTTPDKICPVRSLGTTS